MSTTIDATVNMSGNSAVNSDAKPAKRKLTPEERAMLELMVSGCFSYKAIHTVGDNLAKGIHHVADSVQWATDKTAFGAGVAQTTAVPVAQTGWAKFTGLFSKKS